jgi:hypothetical protein
MSEELNSKSRFRGDWDGCPNKIDRFADGHRLLARFGCDAIQGLKGREFEGYRRSLDEIATANILADFR